jgi:hypothetical protein
MPNSPRKTGPPVQVLKAPARVEVVFSAGDIMEVLRLLNRKVDKLGAEVKALRKHLQGTPNPPENGTPLPPLPTRPVP